MSIEDRTAEENQKRTKKEKPNQQENRIHGIPSKKAQRGKSKEPKKTKQRFEYEHTEVPPYSRECMEGICD